MKGREAETNGPGLGRERPLSRLGLKSGTVCSGKADDTGACEQDAKPCRRRGGSGAVRRRLLTDSGVESVGTSTRVPCARERNGVVAWMGVYGTLFMDDSRKV